ncbi:MAG: hypothetical protein WD766_02510 [Gemmatimonadota bacterium]
MRRLLRGAACILSLHSFGPSEVSAQSGLAGGDREVITRDDLEAAGILRVVDLMPWIATAAGAVEGLTWIASIDGLPPAHLLGESQPDWAIVVDGQPVNVATHGAVLPELIPVTLQQIDSVVVIRSAAIVAGRFAERGVVHFHTAEVRAGASASGSWSHGAETGDPGPYAFTPRATPNIDRSGPDRAGVAAYGGRGWDVEVSGRRIRTAVSDSILWAIYGESARIWSYARGASFRIGAEALGGRHEVLLARHIQVGNSYLPGLADLEHPRTDRYHAGLAGGMAAGAGAIGYRLTHGLIASHVRTESHQLHDIARSHASAELRLPIGSWSLMGGLAVDLASLELGSPTEPTRGLRRAFPAALASLEHRSGERSEQLLMGLRRNEWGVATQLAAYVRWRLGGDRTLSGSLSLADPVGDGLADPTRPSVPFGSRPSPRRIMRGSIGLEQRLGPILSLDVAAVAGRLSGLAGDEEPGSGAALSGPADHFGIHATLESSSNGRVHGRLAYRGTRHLGGATALAAVLETAPRHRLSGRLAYRLHPSFRLGAGLLLKSAVEWPAEAYRRPGAAGLDPISRLDLSIEKWFWSGRLRTQLIVANALQAPERYHPAGADFALRYFVGAALELPARRQP